MEFVLRQETIRTRFIVVGTIVLMLAFLLLSYLNYDASREWTRHEITTSALPLTRDNIYSEIHADLIQPLYVSSTMANDSFLDNWAINGEKDPEPVVQYLREIQQKYGYFSVFFVSARTHKYYHFKGILKTISPDDGHDVWFYRFVESNVEYRLEVDADEAADNTLTIFINFRVESPDGELLGVTGVGMKMDSVRVLLSEAEARYGRRIYMVDRKGIVQAHTETDRIGKSDITMESGIRTIAKAILSSTEGPNDYNYHGTAGKVFVTSRFIPEFKWFLIVEQDENALLSSARINFYRTIVFGLCVWLIVVVVVLVIANRQHARLREMARTDLLTGLPNRRVFEETFPVFVSRYERNRTPFSLVIMDLDGFKIVNDELGHLVGDRMLKAIGTALYKAVRPVDMVARWGGDEFIVLAECSEKDVDTLVKRLREAVEKVGRAIVTEIGGDVLLDLSASCGVAEYAEGLSLDDMTSKADEKLYVDKRERNSR